LSTKVGETFADGKSTFDFSEAGVRSSLERSRQRLKADVLDIVLIHSPGNDCEILDTTAVVPVLQDYRERGVVRAIGLSGKTVEGARQALAWANVLMVEYHSEEVSHRPVIEEARQAGVAVIVKKGLGSGRLPPQSAIPFVLGEPGVSSLVVGSLNGAHFQDNWELAVNCRRKIEPDRQEPPVVAR
jgi:aryl-alcohol dehydrogenase-like predicted oxidoreductase